MRNRQTRFPGAILIAALTFAAGAYAQTVDHPATIEGHPNFNGVWQTINSANWNLEAHSAEPLSEFWQMGAIAAIPAGQSVVKEGTIPYLPAAMEQRELNKANWPKEDNEAKCYMLGIPRYMYHNMPFQIFQSDGDMLMVYPFAAGNRTIWMSDDTEPPVDSWMGKSRGHWDGEDLVVVTTGQYGKWLDRAGNFASDKLTVTERFKLLDPNHIWYEATMEDPETYSAPWTIEMPLYRLVNDNAEVLEHKCVPFADMLLYSDLVLEEDDESEQ